MHDSFVLCTYLRNRGIGPSMKDSQHRRSDLPESVLKSYRNGHTDLAKVIQRHEESFQTIEGSTHGLTPSVLLFESNSHTFHRVQDCLYNSGEFEKALEFAEQSRIRSLGELMFERCRNTNRIHCVHQ